jgi:hypothetical protein
MCLRAVTEATTELPHFRRRWATLAQGLRDNPGPSVVNRPFDQGESGARQH